ncbi:hypothetical protein [Streptomyces sp. NPDC059072]|uniref:hypothetical protein n=1 Tax=Streptomyces sp. NPDC059072 TaxID=3346715 RepID=UPI0036C0135E
MKDFDLEEELAAAMFDRSRQEPPRSYDADDLIASVRQRRLRHLQTGAAAAVVLVALGAGFVSHASHDRGSTPAGAPSAGTASSAPTVTPSSPAPPTSPARTASTLFLSALRYQNPATRSKVDPAEVAALFVDESTYQRIWGADSRGATCGAAVDGVLVAGEVLLYQGTEQLERTPSLHFDATGKVTDLTCATVTGDGKAGDPTVSGFYGGLVTATKAGDSTAIATLGKQFVTEHLRSAQGPTAGTCFSTTPQFWLADNPTSGTLTHGWTIDLDDGGSFPIDIDENAKIARSCGG